MSEKLNFSEQVERIFINAFSKYKISQIFAFPKVFCMMANIYSKLCLSLERLDGFEYD